MAALASQGIDLPGHFLSLCAGHLHSSDIFAGVGGASRRGILIKGSNYLESLARLGTVVFDKTGTLTEGKFSVTAVCASGNHDEKELLSMAAAAEKYSDHPVATALKRQQNPSFPILSMWRTSPVKG